MKLNFLSNIVLLVAAVLITPLARAEISEQAKRASEEAISNEGASRVERPDMERLKCGETVKRILFDESANNSPKGPHTLSCYDVFIDFDSGRIYPGLDPNEASKFDSLEAWLRVKQIDAQAVPGKMYRGFMGYEMLVLPTKNCLWDYPGTVYSSGQTSAGQQEHFYEYQMDVLKKGKLGSHIPIRTGEDLPETFLFRTREGSIGFLQITGFNIEHMQNSIYDKKSIEFRYKIIERLKSKD